MSSSSVRSFRKSGMSKASPASPANGNIASQGLKEDYNSTYNASMTDTDREVPSNIIDLDIADSSPINLEFVMRLPDKVIPLGTVDLSSVNKRPK